MSKQVKKWNDKDGIFRMSERNWMEGIPKANIPAIMTYREIDAIEVTSGRFKSLEGLYIMHRGERL